MIPNVFLRGIARVYADNVDVDDQNLQAPMDRFHKPRMNADRIIESTHSEIAEAAEKKKSDDPFAGFSEL